MKVEHLAYVLEVEKCRSINKASRKLFVNQQQLSRVIRGVEEEIGAQIFERHSYGVEITESGRDILAKTAQMLALYDELLSKYKRKDVHESIKGKLKVYSVNSIWDSNGELVSAFSQAYPEVRIEFVQKSNQEVIDLVNANPLSVGIIVQINDEKSYYNLPESLESYFAYESPVVAYASKESVFYKNHKSFTIKNMSQLPIILLENSPFYDNFFEVFSRDMEKSNIKYVVDDRKSFFDILNKGTCLTVGIAKNNNKLVEGLAAIPIRDKIRYIPGIIFPRGSLGNPVIKTFVDFYKGNYERVSKCR